MSELLYWLWLSEQKNVGSVTAMKYIDYFGSVKRVFEAGFDEIIRVPGSRRPRQSSLITRS